MICVPGDDVAPLQDGLMRGHGTYAHSNQLVSCGAGRIERVNKLASVRPVRGRYTGSVGDLVVGEIVEVAHRSWKVDVGSTRKATLAITSVTLPVVVGGDSSLIPSVMLSSEVPDKMGTRIICIGRGTCSTTGGMKENDYFLVWSLKELSKNRCQNTIKNNIGENTKRFNCFLIVFFGLPKPSK